MQNVKNLRISYSKRTSHSFTRAREYFIGHIKYRSALGCKSLKSYEVSGSPSRRVRQEGTPGEKGRIRKDAKKRKVTVLGRRDTRGNTKERKGSKEEVGDGAVGGRGGGAEGSRRDVARGRIIS